MAPYDNYASDSDRHSDPPQTDSGTHTVGRQRISFEQRSLTPDNGGGGIHRPFPFVTSPVLGGEGQTTIAYWESRDLSRRPNIHRSHLSSSIQTGFLQIIIHTDIRGNASN